ncbi:hypothetical protein ACFL00_03115 [Pseudomonadota bacterium]
MLFTICITAFFLTGCDEDGASKNFTVTFSDQSTEFPAYLAFAHPDHAHDWVTYLHGYDELCAEYHNCILNWYAGKAPKSLDELENAENEFQQVAAMNKLDGEFALALIDCDYIINAPETYRLGIGNVMCMTK